MASFLTVNIIVLIIVLISTTVYLLRGKLWGIEPDNAAKRQVTQKEPESGNDRDIVKKMETDDKDCAIFFGSQTGVAESLASQLAEEGQSRWGLKTIVCDLEDYDYKNLDEFPADKVAIFLLATYGEGEPTDNAIAFYNFITADDVAFKNGGTANDGPLSNMKYVSFGLGNTTYEHFNRMSRKINATLQKLGAKRIGEAGESDDGERTVEDDFLAWKELMWVALAQCMGLKERDGEADRQETTAASS